MYVPVKVGERSLVGAWSVDTIVLPAYRGQGIGKRLQRANQSNHEVFMSLSMSASNRAIKIKLGGTEGPSTRLYVRIRKLNAGSIHEKAKLKAREGGWLLKGGVWLLGHTAGFRAIASLLGFLLRLKQMQQRTEPRQDWIPTMLGRGFGDEADVLWKAVREDYDFSVERNSSYLNWKFRDQPGMKCEQCYAFRDGVPSGLVVFQSKGASLERYGIIHEIICGREDHECAKFLIDVAWDRLCAKGAQRVYCASALAEHWSCLA